MPNRCEDLRKLIVNLINFSFVSYLKSSDTYKLRLSNLLFGIFLGNPKIKLQVPLKSYDISLVQFWQRSR